MVFLEPAKAWVRQAPPGSPEARDNAGFRAPADLLVHRALRDTLVLKDKRVNQATRDSMAKRVSRVTGETPDPDPSVFPDCPATLETRAKGATRDFTDRTASPAFPERKEAPATTVYPEREVVTVPLEGRDSPGFLDETGSPAYPEKKERSATRVNQALTDFLVNPDIPAFLDSRETRAMREGQGSRDSPECRETPESVAM